MGKVEKEKYPWQVAGILVLGFTDAYSFYGVTSIMSLYLQRWLKFDDSTVQAVFHTFVFFVYLTPVFGGMIADGKLGKFKMLTVASIIYVFGYAVFCFTSFPPNLIGKIGLGFGILLFGLGTSGTKALIPALGADQYSEKQLVPREQFFSIYYLLANIASFFAIIITPQTRAVKCYGSNCFPLAFGVTGCVMLLGLIIFLIFFKLYKKIPPMGDLVSKLISCIISAIQNKFVINNDVGHWLDRASEKFSLEFIEDTKSILKVLFLFIPLPMFWALFDQIGSSWTLQASTLNGYVGNIIIEPDMAAALNPLLVVILIPFIEFILYPCLNKCNILNKPIQKIATGMFMAAASFILAAVLQLAINNTAVSELKNGIGQVQMMNIYPNCSLIVNNSEMNIILNENQASNRFDFKSGTNKTFTISGLCYTNQISKDFNISIENKIRKMYLLEESSSNEIINLHALPNTLVSRAYEGMFAYRFVNRLDKKIQIDFSDGNEETKYEMDPKTETEYNKIGHGNFKVVLDGNTTLVNNMEFRSGLSSTLILRYDNIKQKNVILIRHDDISPHELSIFLVIPQHTLMSLAECLFSITGLSFAYSQAPTSMKAILQAAWCLTNAFGNLIVVILSKAINFTNPAYTLFLYAGLMILAIIIFLVMSYGYKYKVEVIDELIVDDAINEKVEKLELENGGFQIEFNDYCRI